MASNYEQYNGEIPMNCKYCALKVIGFLLKSMYMHVYVLYMWVLNTLHKHDGKERLTTLYVLHFVASFPGFQKRTKMADNNSQILSRIEEVYTSFFPPLLFFWCIWCLALCWVVHSID